MKPKINLDLNSKPYPVDENGIRVRLGRDPGLRMEHTGEGGDGGGNPDPNNPDPKTSEGGDPPKPDPAKGDSAPKDISELPEWAQKEIKVARTDAQKFRGERNDARTEAQKQADDLAKVKAALGLTDGEPSADDLQNALQAKDNELRSLKIENAFSKAAKSNNADETLTLAVLSHNKALEGLNPDDAGFATELDALVKAAVEANPKLKVTQEVTKSGKGPMNGNNGDGRPAGPADLTGALTSHYNG